MKKKLQVFISSTYIDLQEERQAAVEAVLSAGHIPAGMELFRAEDVSQMETIKNWIDESDIYLLILGGRYGTLEEKSQLSYTHWEYEYAASKNIPRFAIVITEKALEEKAKNLGSFAIEKEHYPKYQEFRSQVLSKTSKFFDDIKDIKLAILQTLSQYSNDSTLSGWISGKELPNNDTIFKQIDKLLEENQLLRQKLEKQVILKKEEETIYDLSFEERINNIIKILRLIQLNSTGKLYATLKRNYNFSYPSGSFYVYCSREEAVKEKIHKIHVINSSYEIEDFNSDLAEIRIMLNNYRGIDYLKILFVIAVDSNNTKIISSSKTFFENALEKSKTINKDKFSLEIWNLDKVKEIETELGLNIV